MNQAFSQKETIVEHKVDSIQKLISKSKTNKDKYDNILLKADYYLALFQSDDSLLGLYEDDFIQELNKILSEVDDNRSKNILAKAYFFYGKYFSLKNDFQNAADNFKVALSLYTEIGDLKEIGEINFRLGDANLDLGNLDKSIHYYFTSIENSLKASDTIQIMNSYHSLGITYYYLGNYDSSLYAFEQQYDLSTAYKKDESVISRSLSALGTINYSRGNYSEALTYALESLQLSESKKEVEGICRSLINVGNIYKDMNSDSLALKYYNDALVLLPENEKNNKSAVYNNIGIIYQNQNQFDLAKQNYLKALNLSIEVSDSAGMQSKYINLGSVSTSQKNYSEAINYYSSALQIAERRNDVKRIANIHINIADLQVDQNRTSSALANYQKAMQINNQLGSKELQRDIFSGMSRAYKINGNFENALDYYEKYSITKDSLLNEDSQNAFAEMQTKYETDKKQQEIELLNTEKDLQDAKIKRDKLFRNFTLGFLAFVLLFLAFAFRQLRIIRNKNELLRERNYEIQFQKEEIENKSLEIEKQRDIVVKQKEEITDSIYYARRIQKAILPRDTYVEEIMPDHFILFRPRDIVSGDFYWIRKVGNKLITIAADCTGHGVPGAFMSMLGISFLNEIISEAHIPEAHEILNHLRSSVKSTLDQTGKADEAKDGMDVALCIVDFDKMELQYAGAYNPLYIYRREELMETKADKMPIGIYIKEKESFTQHTFPIQKGDTFYIFSDGYVDQFGGENKRKFMAKPFKYLLSTIQDKSMLEQKEILEKNLDEWKGDLEQVDDIIVIGVRI